MTKAGPAAARGTSGPIGAAGARGNTTEKRCIRHTGQKRIHRYISGIANPNRVGQPDRSQVACHTSSTGTQKQKTFSWRGVDESRLNPCRSRRVAAMVNLASFHQAHQFHSSPVPLCPSHLPAPGRPRKPAPSAGGGADRSAPCAGNAPRKGIALHSAFLNRNSRPGRQHPWGIADSGYAFASAALSLTAFR
jgi:hypothetical protein